MPVGVGAEIAHLIPDQAFVLDPQMFFSMTRKNVATVRQAAHVAGNPINAALPQVGVLSKLRIVFAGTLTVATAAATTSDVWPYGFLKNFVLSVAGQELWSCDGLDLHVNRFLRYPAYREFTDVFPDVVGGGGNVGVGTYTVYLTWEVPVAMDDTTLIASLFRQSSAFAGRVQLTPAANADLFTANPANATLAGTWYVQETFFDIPFDDRGQLVLPDVSRLHGFVAVEAGFNGTGDQRTELIRADGQLQRLYVSVRNNPTSRLSAQPNAAATKKIDALRLEYGGNQRPFVYDPASTLLTQNNEDYGATLPYDRLVLDNIKENPLRDLLLLQGVTELAVVPKVGTGVTVAAGASVRAVEETLF